jgi:hypothetical protein
MLDSSPIQVGTSFRTIAAAKDAIKTVFAGAQELWKTTCSDKQRFNIICKEASCRFRVQAIDSKRNGVRICQTEKMNLIDYSRVRYDLYLYTL